MALESLGVRVLILGMGEFRRDLGTIRQDLSATENAIGKMGTQTLSVGQRLNALGDGMIALGRSMTLGLTVPLGILGATLGNAGVSFEKSFAGISKTVEGVAVGFDEIKDAAQRDLGIAVTNMDEARAAAEKLGLEFGDLTPVGQKLRDEFRQLALDIPIPTNELNRLGEVIGQLGVSAEDLPEVTRVVAELGVATDIAAEDAAFGLVKIFNIIEEEGADIVDFMKRAGSTIVALGNNSAATEGEILNFGLRLAAAGEKAKFSEPQLFAWATTLADVGARAELGGTAVSRALNEMVFAVETGDESLKTWAAVTNQSVDQFVKAFEQDASAALLNFVGDLKTGIEEGRVTKDMLNELGLGGVRALDVIGRLGEAQSRFTKNLETANQAWEESIALEEEAAKRFNTISSQLQFLKNSFTDLGITIFDLVKDDLSNFINGLRDIIGWFKDLDPSIQLFIVRMAGIVAALGPVIAGIGIAIKVAGALAVAFASPLAPILAIAAALGLVALAITTMPGINLGALLGVPQDTKEAPASTFNRKNEGVETTPFDPLVLEHIKEVRSLFDGIVSLGGAVVTIVSDVFSAFAKGFETGFKPFLDGLGPQVDILFGKFDTLGQRLEPLGEAFKEFFKAIGIEANWESFGEFLGDISGDLLDMVLNTITNLVDVLGFLALGLTGLLGILSGTPPQEIVALLEQLNIIFTALGEKLSFIGDDIRNFFTNFGNNIGPFFGRMVEEIGLFFTSIFESIGLFFTSLGESISLFFAPIGEGIGLFFANLVLTVTELFNQINIIFTAIGTAIQEAVATAIAFLVGKFLEAQATAQTIGAGISGAFETVKVFIAGVIADIATFLSNFGQDMETARADAVRIMNAVGAAFTSFKDKAIAAIKAVIDKLIELVQQAQETLAGITGSPELKIQHPFELFEDFLKNTNIPGMVADVLLSPSSAAQATTQAILPAGAGGGTTIDKSLNIGDISGVPMQNEGSLAEVLLKTTRRIQAMGSV